MSKPPSQEVKEARERKPEFQWEKFEEIDAIEAPVDAMTAAAFSPDGKFIIGNEGKIIKLLNAQNGKEVFKFESQAELTSMALRRDGILAAADENGDLRFFETQRGTELKKYVTTDPVTALTMTPEGKVVYADKAQAIKEYDFATKESRPLMSARARASVVAVSSDLRVAYGDKDGYLEIGDMATKQYPTTLQNLGAKVSSLAFAPDGKLLVGLDNGSIKVLDAGGNEIKTLEGHSEEVVSLSATPENRVVSASKDGTIRTWAVAEKKI